MVLEDDEEEDEEMRSEYSNADNDFDGTMDDKNDDELYPESEEKRPTSKYYRSDEYEVIGSLNFLKNPDVSTYYYN